MLGSDDDGDDDDDEDDPLAAAAAAALGGDDIDDSDGGFLIGSRPSPPAQQPPPPPAAPAASAAAASSSAACAADASAAADSPQKGGLVRPQTAAADPWLIREYVDQLITPEVTGAAKELCAELVRLQTKAYNKDPAKASIKKRYVSGLREVVRSLRTNKAKGLIVAHNIEEIASEHGLDATVSQLLALSKQKLEWVFDDEAKVSSQQLVPRETAIPVVYAFSRKQLSKALLRASKASVVAILNYDGCHELWEALLRETAAAREAFRAVAVPPRWSPAAPAPRRLVLLKPKTKESDSQVPTDELVAPLAGRAEAPPSMPPAEGA